jgi:endoglucanase
VYRQTGKYPALTGFDYMHIYGNWVDYGNTAVVENWWNNNGIVTACWHWNVPRAQGSSDYAFYTKGGEHAADGTVFDISKAVQEGTYENGIVKADLQKVADKLLLLKNKNIPVLWRPLHEAAGGWFWWGAKGAEPCKALWKMMFNYFQERGLNNLIWIWTAEPKDIVGGQNVWYPGDEYVDIIGRDIYNQPTAAYMLSEYNRLKTLYPTKTITLSEFGSVAGITEQWNAGATWSWMMPWYDYNRTKDPSSAAFDSEDHIYANATYWRNAFANDKVLSRDEMPAWNNNASFVGAHGQLSVKGVQLVDKNGEALVLRGVSFGWHNWWSQFYTKETVAWLKSDWKANVVRAAIGAEPDGAYMSNPTLAMQCLNNVADAAIANDQYVIVDWHSHGIHLAEAKEFFTQVATKYKDVPNVIYELYNEPLDYITWADVKAYSIELIKTIRAIDAKNIILVGSPHWDQDVHIAADDPIKGYDNLMYTLHFYAATHKKELRARGDYALSKNLPIFVSECAGMEASGDGAVNTAEWKAWLQWMADHHLSWAAWSISNKEETCSMIVPGKSTPVSNWKDSDLQDWGKTVREELKIKN